MAVATGTTPSQWHNEETADLETVIQILTEQAEAANKASRRKG